MQKILFIGLWLGFAAGAFGSETFGLTDGTSLSGEIVKSGDNGLFLHCDSGAYTNIAWGHFTQDTLKMLAQKPKVQPFAEVFIEPAASPVPAPTETTPNAGTRPVLSEIPSFLGGLFGSSVGRFILLVLYLGNLLAAFEIATVRGRSKAQVVGLAAVGPLIVPIVFLILPIQEEAAPPEAPVETVEPTTAPAEEPAAVPEEVLPPAAKVPDALVFSRGKYTFNKRFMETKFAGYIRELKGDALKFSMIIRTAQAEHAVGHITQVGQTDLVFESAEGGPVTLPLAEIQEILLCPREA